MVLRREYPVYASQNSESRLWILISTFLDTAVVGETYAGIPDSFELYMDLILSY